MSHVAITLTGTHCSLGMDQLLLYVSCVKRALWSKAHLPLNLALSRETVNVVCQRLAAREWEQQHKKQEAAACDHKRAEQMQTCHFFCFVFRNSPVCTLLALSRKPEKKPQTTKSHFYRLQFDSESVSALVKSLRPIRSYYTPARSQLRGLQMYRGPARTWLCLFLLLISRGLELH